MKRKLIALLLVFVLVISSFNLVACGEYTDLTDGVDSNTNNTDDNKNNNGVNGGNNTDDNTNTGNSGNTGNTGNTGDTGDTGNTGNTGNNGNTGNTGNNGNTGDGAHVHTDVNNDDSCDTCYESVLVVIDFYSLNDLHGKFCDTDTQPGVDELATFLKNTSKTDDNVVILSSGDMWQGTAESNLTHGKLLTEWMNSIGVVSMTLGNHEFDWGVNRIRENLEVADFPFLAINVYENSTGQLADFCVPSVVVERDGIQIGIIGAIGDCYSSISSDMTEGYNFKVKTQLTALVKAEATRLRQSGVDIIVYSLHDGYGTSSSGLGSITNSNLSAYYDSTLSAGYVDIVFEAHSHKYYTLKDTGNAYHVQGGGENYGISHAELAINSVNGNLKVNEVNVIKASTYSALEDDEDTEALEDKYSEIIDKAYNDVIGVVSTKMSDSQVEQLCADLYLRAGLERWGDEYDIVLGGGFLKTRSPYELSAGNIVYADLLSILPFDNRLVLCSVSGSKLDTQFINSTNSDYYIAYSTFGSGIKDSFSSSGTYYIVVDTYTAYYAYNGLTIIDFYDEDVYARDLVADEIATGRFDIGQSGYTLTSIKDALTIGANLASGAKTADSYYIEGQISSISGSNIYIKDGLGNSIYLYRLSNDTGTTISVGDTIVVCGQIYNYQGTTIELYQPDLIKKK